MDRRTTTSSRWNAKFIAPWFAHAVGFWFALASNVMPIAARVWYTSGMAKDDTLDRKKALAIGWRFATGEQLERLQGLDDKELEAVLEGPARRAGANLPKATGLVSPEERRRIEAQCDQLEQEVRLVWAMEPGEAQARETARLAAMVAKLGVWALAMGQRKLSAVRLVRLLVRYSRGLERRLVRKATMAITWMDLHGPAEAADLIVEAAELGDSRIEFMLDACLLRDDMHQTYPGLGRELAPGYLGGVSSFTVIGSSDTLVGPGAHLERRCAELMPSM